MADHIWVSTNGDWNDTASWHDGTVPASGDRALFLTGSQAVTGGLDQSAINDLTLVVDPDYHGAFGSSGSPLLGGTGWTISFDGRNVSEAHFEPGDNLVAHVLSTSEQSNALVLDGGGSNAKVYVRSARQLTLAAGLALNTLHLLTAAATARLLSGLSLTYAQIDGGTVVCDAQLSYLYLRAGRWLHQGTNTNNITNAYIHGGVLELLGCTGATIGPCYVYGGTVDARADKTTKTITNAYVYPRGALLLDNGADTITATVERFGGLVTGGSNVTITETVPYLGLV